VRHQLLELLDDSPFQNSWRVSSVAVPNAGFKGTDHDVLGFHQSLPVSALKYGLVIMCRLVCHGRFAMAGEEKHSVVHDSGSEHCELAPVVLGDIF
jgi:hypothetical protein